MFVISKLTLYSTSSCPNCDVVKKQLNSEGVVYEISQDLSEMRKLGIRSVPALVFNNKILFGNDILKNIDEIKKSGVEVSSILIMKRNGNTVNFDTNRISKAVEKAMSETAEGVDSDLSNTIAQIIRIELDGSDKTYTVEDIQDKVEQLLMDSNRKDVAKQYILYRDMRNKNRDVKESKYKLLDDEFISNYKHLPNPMSPLGEFVYYRTYSRWLPEEKRREYWWETCRRAVEFNTTLIDGVTKEEAYQLFDNMYNLRLFPSGRQMWVGGTKSSIENAQSNYNCAFLKMDKFDKYKELFLVLMLGAGCGVRVLKEDVNKLPTLRHNINVIHEQYVGVPKHNRNDSTSIEFIKSTARITIGDSRDGWSSGLEWYLRLMWDKAYKHIECITFNYNNVRPKGEKLLTFGG